MTARDKAKKVIADMVLDGRDLPRTHSDFDDYGYLSKIWYEERGRAIKLQSHGKLVQWAQALRPRMEKPKAKKTGIDVANEDQKFYLSTWKQKQNEYGKCQCEECGDWLYYSATYVSHNLSRGAHPKLRHHPENVTILCLMHHTQWEDSHKRKRMRIYPEKLKVMQKLLEDERNT